MTTPRRLLATGALIAIPVAFAVGSVVLAQMPPSPQIPSEPVTVQLAPPAPSEEPAPAPAPVVPAPAPAPPPAPAPAPAPPAPPAGDDDDDDGGDDD
ncbi:hypothetical protein ABTZ44_10515 [Microbacterium oxydans]|uniref:hypothetical protein n=1 Tax=Microbacterium TaxID=33882 RepID=UPI0015CC8835|nr:MULTISPECIES: hypothetical protein [Microbacterium]MBE7953457.1 hypothetical protein [Microbacterium sp. R1]NYF27223.1 hypothetical protein [Microbacterium sp. JAI119]